MSLLVDIGGVGMRVESNKDGYGKVAHGTEREMRVEAARMIEERSGPETPFAWWWLMLYDILLIAEAAIIAPDDALPVVLLALASVVFLGIEHFFARRRGMRYGLAGAACFTAFAVLRFISSPLPDSWAVGLALAGIAIMLVVAVTRVAVAVDGKKGDRK